MKKIYFAYFETENSKHDRLSRLDIDSELDIFDWIKEQRLSIEEETGKSAVLVRCDILTTNANRHKN